MYLIDTHILLWLLSEPEKLSPKVKKILQEEELYISMASLWEIATKQSNGKLELPFTPLDLYAICLDRDIKVKQILPLHFNQLLKLPKIHNDPFDRLIISQAQADDLMIITCDAQIHKYDVKTVW